MIMAAAAAAKRLVVLFSPSLPPERSRTKSAAERGKMISDRCPRSSTRRSPFLALAFYILLPDLFVLPLDTPLFLSSAFFHTSRPSTPSYFHAPCLSLFLALSPPRRAVRPRDLPDLLPPPPLDLERSCREMPGLLVIYPGGRVIPRDRLRRLM